MRVAYVQALGGASGDMLLASLIDAGLKIKSLEKIVGLLGVRGVTFKESKSERNGVSGTHLDVILDSEAEKPRRWQDFVSMVEASSLSSEVKNTASGIFALIGEAESRVHGSDVEHVHLHELGTLDTLVDVVGVIAGLEIMGVKNVFCSSLPTGSGTVRTAHGRVMVPAPATETILAMTSAPSHAPPASLPSTGEMLTPTGAAILGSIAEFEAPVMTIESVGYGLGTRNPDSYPNALSLTIGEIDEVKASEGLKLIETNLDDSTGEILGYVQQALIAKPGVRDVWTTPISMKKDRPAIMLSVLIEASAEAETAGFILRETSSLGIRTRSVDRVIAERSIEELSLAIGTCNVKIKSLEGQPVSASPEFEDCKRIAEQIGIPVIEVMKIVQSEADKRFLAR